MSPVEPVNRDGMLLIAWPLTDHGEEVDLDVILATATMAETQRSSPAEIADAWLRQSGGHERYFFENVHHGIRTPDDALIWQRIEEGRPTWLSDPRYAEAIAMLRDEAARAAHRP
jgi:hypothetical protein